MYIVHKQLNLFVNISENIKYNPALTQLSKFDIKIMCYCFFRNNCLDNNLNVHVYCNILNNYCKFCCYVIISDIIIDYYNICICMLSAIHTCLFGCLILGRYIALNNLAINKSTYYYFFGLQYNINSPKFVCSKNLQKNIT